MRRQIEQWLNRNVGIEGFVGCLLGVLVVAVTFSVLVLALLFGMFVIGPILSQLYQWGSQL